MRTEIDLALRLQSAIAQAVENAAKDLGLSLGSLDVSKRERLEQLIVQLVHEGEWDGDALATRAVARFRTIEIAATG